MQFLRLSVQGTRARKHTAIILPSSSKQNNLPAWVHRISCNQAKFLNHKILSLQCTHDKVKQAHDDNSSGQQH
jgi:hypothetical protein